LRVGNFNGSKYISKSFESEINRTHHSQRGLEKVENGSKQKKQCLVSCGVLQKEIQKLIKSGELEADVVFVSKMFHVDYGLLEKNLRRILEKTLPRYNMKPVLVYGDLCLGPNNEMRQLAEEYDMIKVDALNCIDCLLGGKGKIEESDPNHEFMFMDPGMIEFFCEAHRKLEQEGMDEGTFKNMFCGIKGIVLLDTLNEAEKCKQEIEKLHTGLAILETKKVGLDNLKHVLSEAIRESQQRRSRRSD